MITPEQGEQIKQLARTLTAMGVGLETGKVISMIVLREPDRLELMEWLKTHPQATSSEIRGEARAITKRNNGL